MYIKVRLLNGWNERLVYKISAHQNPKGLVDTVIRVPLQKRTELALVESVFSDASAYSYAIKEVFSCESLIHDCFYKDFIGAISSYYALDRFVLYRRLLGFLKKKEVESSCIKVTPAEDIEPQQAALDMPVLTDEQQRACDGIFPFIKDIRYQACVLYGVTGSGKTEVYYRLMVQNNLERRTVIMLVPEVSLAIQFTNFFKKRCASKIPVFGFHSATSIKEKRVLWEYVRDGIPVIIVGVHLPVLLPFKNLGLIIVDEEHETGYQEKQYPKFNTKEMALLRANIYNIPIILGSATPSIGTLYNVENRGWKMFEIKKRFAGAFPRINLVKLDPKQKRSHYWISRELEAAIAERLNKKEQILLFLNRRGHSFFVQCLDCGFIFRCSACSVALTYHENNSLLCHYCSHTQGLDEKCSACAGKRFMKKGIGTQQVVDIVQRLFPQAHIARADLDTTVNRKKWQATLDAFSEHKIDILVGTQTITKGYHFPGVTLVGILWADMHLGMPVYNATEITLQQIVQVAGRAGRQSPESLVVIQTILDHELFKYISEERYQEFYAYEIKHRQELLYPPFIRFAEIELRHSSEEIVERDSRLCADFLHEHLEKNSQKAGSIELNLGALGASDVRILGPAQPPVHKIKDVHIRKIYLKGHNMALLGDLYWHLQALDIESSLFFTPNPLVL